MPEKKRKSDKANSCSQQTKLVDKPSHVVGIGASAGGLSALEKFFDHMPSDSGMAFVIIQHLSPDFKSLMDDLLARHTKMAIYRVTDGTLLAPDSIYLIPPKSHMTVANGTLFLTEVKTSQHTDLPIDVFFHSLAKDFCDKSVGVILSGTGTDGSRGVKSISQAGGLVLVQSVESAQFDGMPRSAVATGCCDLMIPPETMHEAITQMARMSQEERKIFLSRHSDSETGGEYQQIFTILNNHYKLDFSKYKPTTVGRRIQRRMDFHNLANHRDYLSLLANNIKELDALYHDLLIGVTEFFRDPKAFQKIEKTVIPAIFSTHAPDEDIRVWSAGCATGEEAYSIGILLAEQARQYNFKGNITVFATDVHRGSLDFASQGRYGRERLGKVSEKLLEEYFDQSGPNHYQVNQTLRKMIVFAPHNLINDPPFTRMDLICCRNLLIYLQPDIQEKVLSLFHFALKTKGALFLGSSEGLGKMASEFDTIAGSAKIFQKLRDLNLAVNMNFENIPTRFSAPAIIPVTQQKTVSLDRQLVRDYDFLLKEYMPAGVLVDQDRRILHNFGDVSFFMEPVEGRFENDILAMVVDSLKIPLTTALHRALKVRDQMTTRGLIIEHHGEQRRYDLNVKFIADRNSDANHFFIALQPAQKTVPVNEQAVELSSLMELGDVPSHLQQRILDLEQELRSTKENLQTSVEELQTANEELQTTNEELMASNEELQSTNEELHSVNEELYTVNAEFEDKNRELKDLNQDHVNLMNSIEIGIVYVDTQLKIRKFNPAIEKIFKLMPQDIGRPIDHIAYHLANQAQMLSDIRTVIQTGLTIEKEIETDDGQWLLKRVLPFRTQTEEIKGVVLSFTEITALKEAQKILKLHAEELENKVSERTRSLQQAKDAADQANVAKSSFLANMSHEIRTPMSGVLMAAELLSEMDLSHRQSELVKTLQRGARSLNAILDDILDFSKIEAGKIDLAREPLIIADTIDDVIALYQPRINVKQLTVETKVASDVPEIMVGDPVRLKQILTNLVSNAIKFTNQGGIEVWVDVEKCTRSNCILHFTVRDTGIGISLKSQKNIFEPFAQGDSSLTRNFGGTGLGLSISKQLVELMGGKIWFETSDDGTSFHFTAVLDLLKQPRRQSKGADLDEGKVAINPKWASCKILLAEDDLLNQELITKMIQNIGCQLSYVDNGQSAVAKLKEETFDLVLMDISMPQLDGLTATEIIRGFPLEHVNYDVPIIALTAHALQEDIKKFIGAGMNQVLTKPLSMEALKDVLLTYCGAQDSA